MSRRCLSLGMAACARRMASPRLQVLLLLGEAHPSKLQSDGPQAGLDGPRRATVSRMPCRQYLGRHGRPAGRQHPGTLAGAVAGTLEIESGSRQMVVTGPRAPGTSLHSPNTGSQWCRSLGSSRHPDTCYVRPTPLVRLGDHLLINPHLHGPYRSPLNPTGLSTLAFHAHLS